MKLNVKAFGLACGIVWGAAIFLLTLWFIIAGYDGNTLIKLSKVYLGFKITFLGSIIGFVWGFVDGFIGGALIAWLYNKFATEKT